MYMGFCAAPGIRHPLRAMEHTPADKGARLDSFKYLVLFVVFTLTVSVQDTLLISGWGYSKTKHLTIFVRDLK